MAFVLAHLEISLGEIGLYAHIPFCEARCTYCDFVTFTDKGSKIDVYLEGLAKEVSHYKDKDVHTLFVGGGTPTVLNPNQIDFLFTSFRKQFNLSNLTEATIEANPESTTLEKLKAFSLQGVNRISFGLQATQNTILTDINRLHNFERFLEAYQLARAVGFKNINIDLIFGFYSQTMEMWEETLLTVLRLSPEHISTYALKIEPGTKIAENGFSVDSDLQADMYLLASEFLESNGYVHYEISNFSKPGFESKHNLRYWENRETVGVGVSSTSFYNGKRPKNTNNLDTYLREISKGLLAHDQVPDLSFNEMEKESLMLKLRLKQGVPISQLEEHNIPMVRKFQDQGLASINKGMYSLNPRGWLLSNILFQHFV